MSARPEILLHSGYPIISIESAEELARREKEDKSIYLTLSVPSEHPSTRAIREDRKAHATMDTFDETMIIWEIRVREDSPKSNSTTFENQLEEQKDVLQEVFTFCEKVEPGLLKKEIDRLIECSDGDRYLGKFKTYLITLNNVLPALIKGDAQTDSKASIPFKDLGSLNASSDSSACAGAGRGCE